jgi:transposase InsO family protein
MDEDAKRKVAQFRFGVIHDLIGTKKLSVGEKERLLREKSVSEWDIPFSGRSYISRSTILNWTRMYERGGRRLEALYPDDRKDRGMSRAMDEETALTLVDLKKELKGVTLPVILRVARQRKILPLDFKAGHATIYRLFKRHGVMEENVIHADRRRFEAELPNDIWQSDCMHGPKVDVDGRLRKAYLFAFIDDMSRLIPHAEFYLRERLDSYIDALRKALGKRGLPRKLYVDNGPTFRSQLLSHATASLGVALIHSKPYQPEGRGKIERWHKTLRMQFLSVIPEGLTLEKLNRRLHEWIDNHYHVTVHSSTKEPPLNRYLNHIHLIREAPKDMKDYFRKAAKRKVYKDRTVSLLNKVYEAPVELIGKTVTLLYHEDDPQRVEVFYNNKPYGMLIPLDVNVNCKIRRRQHITEIEHVNTEKGEIEQEDHYRGGRLFEKGDEDDEL